MIRAGKQVFMKSLFPIIAVSITVLIGCGEDVGNRRGSPTAGTPTLTGDNFIVPSNITKSREQAVLQSQAINSFIANNTLPTGYRIVPVIATDDEGASDTDNRTVTGIGRPTVNCGTAANLTVLQRISDCVVQNSTKATWNGTFGGAGETTWKLVTKTSGGEAWIDTRTSLIWSSVVGIANWCNASGNTTKDAVSVVDCAVNGTAQVCVGKSLLGMTGVTWRLPTRNDYLQADIDGLRYVLTDTGSTPNWTATLDSSSAERSKAWAYIQDQGTLESVLLTDSKNVRCVGAAVL